ncbi:hypothetical protein A0127_07855 [Thermococcus peptonophilus]|uniref:Uncharacterized protein n=1 Tax=Thermococcus peptonophilus TaxID=53952 RepID=A0A142CWD2_9EURY|nr:hypothetical protein A0127_07855 [Thermococcus peptonophilus]
MYKFLDDIERESENMLLGRPKSRERLVLIIIPAISFVFVYWMIKTMIFSLVPNEKDILDALFVNNNGENGMAFLMYLSMALFMSWFFGKGIIGDITLRLSPQKLLSFLDRAIIAFFDSLIAWLAISISIVAFLYAIGQYVLYQQGQISNQGYPISVLLFLVLFLGYILMSYSSHKKRLMVKLKYILALSGEAKLPRVKLTLKNGQILKGFLVPFYSDKNVVVIVSLENNSIKVNRVLKYIPWDEISIFELTDET